MQKWEYMTIVRSRGWGKDKDVPNAGWRLGSNWNVDITKNLVELGDQGWELVAVTPRSSYLGGLDTSYSGRGDDYAGFTSDELWVFKRPKQ